MNRILVIGALLLALAGMGYLVYHQTGRVAELQASVTSLTEASNRAAESAKFDRALLVARQKEIASQTRVLAQTRSALEKALQRNQAWSNTNVPDDVKSALREPENRPAVPLGGAPSGPAGVRQQDKVPEGASSSGPAGRLP